jgi:predicted  nucleic acid-binding Zn-ribbon protein
MTDEDRQDFQRIVAAVVEPLAAAVQSLNTRLDDAVRSLNTRLDDAVQSLNTRLDDAVQSLNTRLDAAVQSITAATARNLAELRTELLDRIDRVDRRTERLEINVNAMQLQLAGINRSLSAVEQRELGAAGTFARLQRTVDDLARRVADLEKKAS